MNTPSSTTSGSVPLKESFKDVIVILNDGNEILLQQCKRCCSIIRNHGFSKVSHWKSCPSKYMFKYISEQEGAVVATCLLCHTKLHEPRLLQILDHHKICVKNMPVDFVPNNHIDETSDETQYKYIYESSVTQREVNGARNLLNGISAPGFLIKMVASSRGLERMSECQVCKKSKCRPTQFYFSYHRRQCTLPGEVLMSVTTQPFDMTISSSNDDSQNITSSNQTCFLCNTRSSDSFVNLYEAVSTHSNTPVYDFVWKFLDNKPSERDDSIDAANSTSLCSRCLNKINEYDLACVTATNLEEELRWELSQTEETFAAQRYNIATERIQGIVGSPLVPTYVDVNEETINLDSPPPSEVIATTQANPVDPINDDQCTIELSDDEDTNAIVLSDDES